MLMYAIMKNDQQIGFMFGVKQGAILMLNSIFEHKQNMYHVERINEYKFINHDTNDIFQIKSVIID